MARHLPSPASWRNFGFCGQLVSIRTHGNPPMCAPPSAVMSVGPARRAVPRAAVGDEPGQFGGLVPLAGSVDVGGGLGVDDALEEASRAGPHLVEEGAHRVVGHAGTAPKSKTGCPMRSTASAQYSAFSSMPTLLRMSRRATMSVVPDPANGSRTVPSGGQPAAMQRRESSGGNVAKCAAG